MYIFSVKFWLDLWNLNRSDPNGHKLEMTQLVVMFTDTIKCQLIEP